MMKGKYLSTGEFAKLCHTSKHTLFHYCDIGLFTPVYTDKNGYRYYHVLQYDTFLTIRHLRSIGMSLAQIKQYMEIRSPEKMIVLLREQERSIQRQIDQLRFVQDRLHFQRVHMEQVKNHSCGEVFISEHTDSNIICSDKVYSTDDYAMTQEIGHLISNVGVEEQGLLLGMICDRVEALKCKEYFCRFYIYVKNVRCDQYEKIGGGKYLCTYHYGEYETLQETFIKLDNHARQQGYVLSDQFIVECVVGDWAVKSSKNYVMKVAALIK